MALHGVNNGQDKTQQKTTESFGAFADRLNKTVPDRTSTIEEKQHAIKVKKLIMAHPGCPEETKTALKKEIKIIEGEISTIQRETAMNKGIFGTQNALE